MSTAVEFYQAQAQSVLSSIPWLLQMQTKALALLTHSGFPSRHDEDWKYTQLDGLLQHNYTKALASTKTIASDLPFPVQVSVYNGSIQIIEESTSQLPKDVLILPLAQAMVDHPDLVKPYLGKVLQVQHGFHCLNTAMIQLGVFIYIPEGVQIDTPLVISHYQDQNETAVHLRHLIIAEKGSQSSVIEEYRGQEQSTYFTDTITEVHVGEKARITHFKIQREAKSAFHLGHLAVKQGAHSEFASHSISLGGKLVRSDISIDLQHEYAQCLMNGIYIPTEGQHVDHHTTVHHLVPNCRSAQDYKGILKGRARAVFNGKVIVAKDAQHSDASQQNKNLVLSSNAEIDTKPQLEIFADDVLCSHGATVGQLDEEALFYLATRGIDRAEASQYLIQAFAEDNIRLIPQPQLAAWLGHLITQQVGCV